MRYEPFTNFSVFFPVCLAELLPNNSEFIVVTKQLSVLLLIHNLSLFFCARFDNYASGLCLEIVVRPLLVWSEHNKLLDPSVY